jgi:hypothetical protein
LSVSEPGMCRSGARQGERVLRGCVGGAGLCDVLAGAGQGAWAGWGDGEVNCHLTRRPVDLTTPMEPESRPPGFPVATGRRGTRI